MATGSNDRESGLHSENGAGLLADAGDRDLIDAAGVSSRHGRPAAQPGSRRRACWAVRRLQPAAATRSMTAFVTATVPMSPPNSIGRMSPAANPASTARSMAWAASAQAPTPDLSAR